MHDGGGNGTGHFVIRIWSDAAKLMDMRVAGFRQSRYLIRKKDTFVENEGYEQSGLCQANRSLSSQLSFESNEKKFSIKRVDS